jgi:hypothetical protein
MGNGLRLSHADILRWKCNQMCKMNACSITCVQLAPWQLCVAGDEASVLMAVAGLCAASVIEAECGIVDNVEP